MIRCPAQSEKVLEGLYGNFMEYPPESARKAGTVLRLSEIDFCREWEVYMESSLRKLQKIEADILQVVSKICDEEQIRYYLSSGTLLGAVRHQGFYSLGQ